MSKITTRNLALQVINEVTLKGAYANIALANVLKRQRLTDQDRRFLTELVYGTVKAGQTLDWLLAHYLNRPLASLPPIIGNILCMGVYQLFFLTKIPASAACNEAVQLARQYGHPGTVKLVNAVLRNAARNPEKIVYPDQAQQPVQYLALKYFHPEWMIRRWLQRLGAEATEALCRANNTTPLLALRTNTLTCSRESLLTVLTGEGSVCVPSDWTPEGIVCHEHPSLSAWPSLQSGLFQIQDESSMLAAHVLAPQPGELVIDACGAPGGKSTHIAALMNNTGTVISADIHAHKLALISDNTARLGITIIEPQILDASTLHTTAYNRRADRVLVDAPCSGLGVLRRKPDSRWRKQAGVLTELPLLQQAILQSAAACVKPEGILVYSTCTTEPEENQQVIEQFLREQPDFCLEPAGHYLPNRSEARTVQLWPHIDGIDGFFIARMRRIR